MRGMLFAQTRLYPGACETVGGLTTISTKTRRSEFAEFSAKQRRARSFCRFPPDCHVSSCVSLVSSSGHHRPPTCRLDVPHLQDHGQQTYAYSCSARRGVASAQRIQAQKPQGPGAAACEGGVVNGGGGRSGCRAGRGSWWGLSRFCAEANATNAASSVSNHLSNSRHGSNSCNINGNNDSSIIGRGGGSQAHPLSAKIDAAGGDGAAAFCAGGNGSGGGESSTSSSVSVSSSSSILSIPYMAVASGANDDSDVVEEEGEKVEKGWTAQEGASLYRVDGWGSPYFVVNSAGHVAVRPCGSEDGSDELDLFELLEALRKRNVALPMIIRFPDIVRHRMKQLHECFNSAIARFGYQGHYLGVFPVKCNHERYLVEDIVRYGRQFRFGLEAGSKPEVLIAITMLRESDGALLVCNGYKDRVYIESVLLARQLGVNAIIVLEQMDELPLVIDISRRLGAKPVIGVRAKLSTKHNGHWGETSGDKGKFGLTVMEMVQVVYILKQEGMLDCLQMLHFHIGSQIPSISIIKEAMREASHTYCELALMGAPMGYIDVGGGLGIDYDGTKSQSTASTNYSMQNYANDVVAALMDACVFKGVPQPIITTESGRALASHHSVLVFDVLSASEHSEAAALRHLEVLSENAPMGLGVFNDSDDDESLRNWPRHLKLRAGGISRKMVRMDMDPGEYLLSTFYQVYKTMGQNNFQEAYNDAKQFKSEAGSLFKLGCLSLEQRAQAESLYRAVCHRVLAFSRDESEMPDEMEALRKAMASIYHINLSIFRSAPDSWAIDQIFPIMPVHRLTEEPTMQATLADLTCDSDGKINRFIGSNGEISHVLPVHELRKGEPYYMALFLGGVYQEVMGSLHNLFGATNVVHVMSRPKNGSGLVNCLGGNGNVKHAQGPTNHRGGFSIDRVVRGQTMIEVLRTVQHVGEDMMEELRCEAEDAVADGRLTVEEAQTLLLNYQRSLGSYTYLTR